MADDRPGHPTVQDGRGDVEGIGIPVPVDAAPGWMLTLADLLSLLVAFFALLYATTATDPKDWNRVMRPVAHYLAGAATGGPAATSPPRHDAPTLGAVRDPGDLNYEAAAIERLLTDEPSLQKVRLDRLAGGLRLVFPQTEGIGVWIVPTPSPLATIAQIFARFPGRLSVSVRQKVSPGPAEAGVPRDEGAPVRGSPLGGSPKDGWAAALGSARAVADALGRLGYDRDISVEGRIELAPPTTAEPAETLLEMQLSRTTPAW